MSPIRVGIIGLSGAPPDKYEGTSWAPNAHLPYLKKSPNYEIVALLNTSIETARTAIERYGLPSNTKAYADPADLANDPDVDLVVCSVRVDRHFQTVRPSLIAGKSVYVEWPLDRNLEVAREMAALAHAHNAKNIVGLQGSYSPVIQKVRSIVEGGELGRIASSSLLGSLGNNLDSESKNIRYFLDRNVGGSVMSIHVGHTLETIKTALGPFKSFDSAISIIRHEVDIVDFGAADGGKVLEKGVRNTVPDHIHMYGKVAASNAPVTITLHAGKEFPGLPRLDWRIQGEKGWLRVTSPSLFLNMGDPETKIELFKNEVGAVETVVPDSDEWVDLPTPAQNIARLYEAYRKEEWYPTFDWALQQHEKIDQMWKKFDQEQI